MTTTDDSKPMLPVGKPVRLLAHDWPFLYSVLNNGDLVVNKRLTAVPKRQVQSQQRVAQTAQEEQFAEF